MGSDDAQAESTQAVDEAWHGEPIERGTRLGRYELQDVVGTGGMGVVFAARDPELDRVVAVKVLRSGAGALDGAGAARLRREGVTMARLTHPNVMRVYDVGVERGHVFVAMELVRGCTLADWLRRAPRTTAEILAAFAQAGRGLAAAHDAGLVHRDFKPQNVLVGDDGRVLVTDFGLAREVGKDDGRETFTTGPGVASSPSVTVTRAGEIVGTPAYMAPEQHRSAAVDERADQFSFCVALQRALREPGATSTAMASTVAGGEAPRPAELGPMPRVPARVRAALARGLEDDPDRRWPSMHELLARLEPATSPVRRWLIAAAAGAVVAGGAAWLLAARGAAIDPCPPPDAQLAAVWGDARRTALRDRLLAVDPAQGTARFEAAAREIDPYARAWRDMHVRTCKATRVLGQQSDTSLDRRMRCLEQRLEELDGSIARMAAATGTAALDAAMAGFFQITRVNHCSDERAGAELEARPADRQRRRALKELGREIERVSLDVDAGRLAELPARAAQLVAAARGMDHAPTLAAALRASAEVHLAVDAVDLGVAALRELAQVAAKAQDSRAEAYAWVALVSTIGAKQHRPDEALTLVPAATAAIHRASDPVDLQVDLLRAEATILADGPDVAPAVAKLEHARRLLIDVQGTDSPASSLQLAGLLLETGTALMRSHEPARAVKAYEDAIDVYRRLFGPDSTGEARARHNIGEAWRRAGRAADALPAFREAARINQARTGASPRLASNLVSIASALGELGDWPAAIETYERAHAMYRAQVEPDDVALVAVLVGLAWAYEHVDRVDEADRTYAEILAVVEKSGATTVNLPIALYNRGELNRRRGRYDAALADLRRAAAAFEAIGGPASPYLVYPRVAEGAALVQRGDVAAGLAVLGRVTAATGVDPVQAAKARVWTGRALVVSRRDRAGGLAMVRAARDALATAAAKDPEGARDLVEVDRWLAGRR